MRKQLVDFPNYEIDRNGDLYSIKRQKQLAKLIDKDGYITYHVSNNGIKKKLKAHRLVAEYFIEKKDESFDIVNHINAIKNDNRVENLEWCNASYNQKHFWKLNKGRSSNISKKIKVTELSTSNEIVFDSIAKASDYLGVRLHDFVSGKTKSIRGFDVSLYKFELI